MRCDGFTCHRGSEYLPSEDSPTIPISPACLRLYVRGQPFEVQCMQIFRGATLLVPEVSLKKKRVERRLRARSSKWPNKPLPTSLSWFHHHMPAMCHPLLTALGYPLFPVAQKVRKGWGCLLRSLSPKTYRRVNSSIIHSIPMFQL